MDAPWIPTDAELGLLVKELAVELQRRELVLATAESCTGGWIAKALTDQAGSSAWFAGGVIVYSYQAKQALLGVDPHTLELNGAVSRETVLEMVSGALAHIDSSVAVAVTGIAGPSGGSSETPTGTVWIGWQCRGGNAQARVFHFSGDRQAVRRQAVAMALSGVRQILTGKSGDYPHRLPGAVG